MVSQPVRIQLSRKKGWRLPPNTLNVARPSRYGNPHHIGFCPVCGVTHTRDEAVAEFEAELSQLSANHFEAMRGKNLACWCKLNERCHADVLLRLANESSSDMPQETSELGVQDRQKVIEALFDEMTSSSFAEGCEDQIARGLEARSDAQLLELAKSKMTWTPNE